MIIAAPAYVAKHALSGCPPGHRFFLYYDGWDEHWRIPEGEKAASLRRLVKLAPEARELLDRLRIRQEELAAQAADDRRLVIDAVSTSPLATGLGNEHPVENGFAFLSPYGLPYLAGSGVKGVLRRAAEELLQEGTVGLTQDVIDALFGPEDPAALGEGPPLPDDRRRRGALTFWDVFPEPKGKELAVEIMTPHYGAYYQGADSPHDAGQPEPIPFLALPPGSTFRFIVMFEPTLAPQTQIRVDWKAVLDESFRHAFGWLGFGGKTAVGYGAMRRDTEAEAKAIAAAKKRAEEEQRRREATEREARRAQLSENMRRIEDFKAEFAARAEQLRGGKEKSNAVYHEKARKLAKEAQEGAHWTVEEKRAAAEAIEQWLPKVVNLDMKEERKKLKLAALKGQT